MAVRSRRVVAIICGYVASALLVVRGAFGATIVEYPIPTADSRPFGIAVGSDGNLWFTQFGAERLGRINTAGTISDPNVLVTSPAGICSGPDTNLWVVESVEPPMYRGDAIARVTRAGDLTHFWLPLDPYGDELSYWAPAPLFITAGPDGALWFTEQLSHQVGLERPFTVARISVLGALTDFPVGRATYGIAAGPDGNLWVTQWLGSGVGRITTSGAVTWFNASTAGPRQIVAGPDGNLWFALQPDKIARITPSGAITEFTTPTANSNPDGITAGPDGALWFTEYDGNNIGRITTQGEITEYPIPTPGAGPLVICTGPDGSLWFTEYLAGKIGKLTPPQATGFHPLPPCRIFDTRDPLGPLGGPSLGPGEVREFTLATVCGIPADAKVVSGNVTTVEPSAPGNLRVFGSDETLPVATAMVLRAGRTRANNGIFALSGDALRRLSVQNDSTGALHVLLDVNGYFR